MFEARNPKVSVMIGDVEISVDTVTMYHTINNLPYVEFSAALDNGNAKATGVASIKGVKIDLDKIGQLGKLLQERVMNDFSVDPDVSLDITDGDGNHKVFRGYLGNPTFQVSGSQLIMVFTALHSMASLQAFNPQIYFSSEFFAVGQDPLKPFFQLNRFRSIAKRLQVAIDGLITSFGGFRGDTAEAATATVNQTLLNRPEPLQWDVHSLNTNPKILADLHQVLADSEKLTEIDGIELEDFNDVWLDRGMYDSITGNIHMIDVLKSTTPMFLFQMNCMWEHKLWLEHSMTMEVPRSMIKAPIGDIAFSLASMFEIPVLQVVLQGAGSEFYVYSPISEDINQAPVAPEVGAPEHQEVPDIYDQSGKTLLRYPSQVTLVPKTSISPGGIQPGTYLTVQAPAWIGPDFVKVSAEATTDENPNIDGIRSVADYQKAQSVNFAGMAGARAKVLSYIAKYVFRDVFLRRTNATIRIPFNLAPQVGRTYFIQATGQVESLYIGYLQSVTHTVKIEGNASIADTQLVFTHVRARNANLRSIDNAEKDENSSLASLNQQLDSNEAALNKMAAK